jgi:hypothetical protein
MLSNRLFYEDEYDAYATMIGNSGRSLKECASHLYPLSAAPSHNRTPFPHDHSARHCSTRFSP